VCGEASQRVAMKLEELKKNSKTKNKKNVMCGEARQCAAANIK